MRVYKTIEKRARVYGLSPMDLGLLLCSLVVLLVGAAVVDMFIPVGGAYYLFVLFFFLGSVGVLRRSTQKHNPSFLHSWISYHFFQPKKIVIR